MNDKRKAFPMGNVYEMLYLAYLKREWDMLLNTIIGKNTEYSHSAEINKVLDLCGGTGRLTKWLREQGKDVTYLDICEDMCLLDDSYNKIFMSVEDFAVVEDFEEIFDVIVSSQAVNYWFNTTDVNALAKKLNKDGLLVFNTFATPVKSHIKEYEIDGYYFVEENVVKDGKVYHTQFIYDKNALLMEHHTIFDVITEEEYMNKLSESFEVTKFQKKNSVLYVARKKDC